MKKIVITEFMDQKAVDGLSPDFNVIYDPKLVDNPEELQAQLHDAEGLIVRNRTQVRDGLLDNALQLKAVGRLGVGLDNIDLEQCKSRNIAVFPATGANDLAVAEYVIAAIMMLFRGAYHSTIAMVEGQWPRQTLMGHETSGKKLGLVGFGAIARETAQRAAALGMDILAYDPYLPKDHPAWHNVENLSLDDLLMQSDVISLHVPLTPETRHLIDASAIAKMKNGAMVINAARGGVVDEAALIEGLQTQHLGGAALDVFESEPLVAPIAERFRDLPNLILTPHIAGVTKESNVRVSAVTAENVRKALEG